MLVYNRALSDSEIGQVRSVMASKFDLQVSANQPPTVALANPATGVSLKAGKTLQLAATASDVDGSVVKVRFLAGGQVIGEDAETPYELEWTPSGEGEHLLTAVAVDNRGAETISGVVSVIVLPPNVGPEVVINTPSAGQGVSVGATLKVIASATDSDGEVTEVEILANGESLAKRSEGPYEADWVLAKAGMQRVIVRATDNDGAVSELSVSVAVYGDTPVPADGLRLWLDAGEEVTVSDVGVVSGWGDRSLFGHDVSQSELGLQPVLSADAINGRAAVLFDGEDDVLARPDVDGGVLLSPDAVSVYAVARQKWQSAVNTLLAWEAPNYKNHLALLTSYNNQFMIDHGNVSEGGRVSAVQPEEWDDAWHVLEFVRSGSRVTVNVDSAAVELGEFGSTLNVNLSGTLLVGEAASLAFGGEIAEVLIYNRALDSGERGSVSKYLG
ncbi:MAG TPA: Ig-like domain-containing protein, partial [Verrucomicrobiota bacterium]|nr:Ig-like domain-containing protein [Verrucomicrobiota bacterium]